MKSLHLILRSVFFLMTVLCVSRMQAQTTLPDTVCMGSTKKYWVQNNTSDTVYFWYFSSNAAYLNYSLSSNNDTITIQWSNLTAGDDTLYTFAKDTITGCVGDTVSIAVTRVANPNLLMGPDDTICAGDSYHLDSVFCNMSTSILWTTSGDGSFNDSTLLHPVYTPGPGDIATGVVSLDVTAYYYNCGSSSSMSLFIAPKPGFNIIPPDTGLICAKVGDTFNIIGFLPANYTAFSWSSSGSGTFLNAGLLTPAYIISYDDSIATQIDITIYLSGLAAGCDSAYTFPLIISPVPAITASASTPICEGHLLTLTATSNGGVGFLWEKSPGIPVGTGPVVNIPYALPANSGIYTVHVTYGNGCPDNQFTLPVTVNPKPTTSPIFHY